VTVLIPKRQTTQPGRPKERTEHDPAIKLAREAGRKRLETHRRASNVVTHGWRRCSGTGRPERLAARRFNTVLRLLCAVVLHAQHGVRGPPVAPIGKLICDSINRKDQPVSHPHWAAF
jgi:hypothetical protein